MIGASINFQFGQQLIAEAVFGDHAFDRVGDQLFRVLGADLGHRGEFLSPFPAGIRHEKLSIFFVACERNFLGIDDYDKIARVEVRSINGLVLSPQKIGDLHGKPPENGAVRVNHVPFPLIHLDFGQICFHQKPIKERKN